MYARAVRPIIDNDDDYDGIRPIVVIIIMTNSNNNTNSDTIQALFLFCIIPYVTGLNFVCYMYFQSAAINFTDWLVQFIESVFFHLPVHVLLFAFKTIKQVNSSCLTEL